MDELAQALDALLGLDADRAGLAATVGAYVPDGAAGRKSGGWRRALGSELPVGPAWPQQRLASAPAAATAGATEPSA